MPKWRLADLSDEVCLFKGRKAALLTKHKKEQVIKPVFEMATGCQVIVEDVFIKNT